MIKRRRGKGRDGAAAKAERGQKQKTEHKRSRGGGVFFRGAPLPRERHGGAAHLCRGNDTAGAAEISAAFFDFAV